MTSPITGLTEGDFTALRVLSSAGVMTDILTLIGSGGGGGSTISSATTPLAINSGVLSIDLACYATTAAVNALLPMSPIASRLVDRFGIVMLVIGLAIDVASTFLFNW